MIRAQRRVHRTAFLLLAAAVPALLVLGLRSRSTMLMDEDRLGLSVMGDEELAAPLALVSGDGLEISLPRDWNEPDVLVYALDELPSAGGPAGDAAPENLPAGARLVGALVPGHALPWPAEEEASFVLLYSLAHQRVLALQRVGGGS